MSGRWSALALAVLIAGPACARPPVRDRVVVAFPSGPESLMPDLVNEEFTISVLSNVYESLTDFDAKLTVEPALAESWYTADDLNWIVRLRPGVRFHDGQLLEARHVAASLERARTDPTSRRRAELISVKAIEVRNPSTLAIETHYPFGALPQRLAVVAVWKAPGTPGGPPVGTGPYRVRSWEPGGDIELEAFDGYHRGRPPIRSLEFRVVPRPEERLALLRRGDVHLIPDVPAREAPGLRVTPGLRVLAVRGLRVIFLAMDTMHPRTAAGVPNPFRDLRVRKAAALAIDRAALVAGPLGGFGEVVEQVVAPGVFGYHPRLRPLPHRPQESRALLARAGHAGGFETPLDFMPRKYQAMEQVVDALARDLAAVGIRAAPRPHDTAEFFARLEKRENPFYAMGWMTTGGDAVASYNYLLHTPAHGYGINNGGGYSNPVVDALLEQAARALLPDRRLLTLAALAEKVQEDAAVIPLYRQTDIYGMAKDLRFEPRVDRRIRGFELGWEQK